MGKTEEVFLIAGLFVSLIAFKLSFKRFYEIALLMKVWLRVNFMATLYQ